MYDWGSVHYEINSLNNVTELYSKGFNLTTPPNTHMDGVSKRKIFLNI
jgi:hypothetical protein